MKNFLLAIVVVLSSYGASAQPLQVLNQTGCAFYVTLKAASPTCNSVTTTTYFVPVGSTIVTPPAGWTFEIGYVHSNPMPTPYIPASYYAVIQRPGPASGWPAWCSLVWGADAFAECAEDTDCTGITAESCWGGAPSSPVITIVN